MLSLVIQRHPPSTLFPYTTLFRSFCGYFFSRLAEEVERLLGVEAGELRPVGAAAEAAGLLLSLTVLIVGSTLILALAFIDRKSTRLNSSHLVISYAVFCLKKKIAS